jgi:hypothetical protein
MSGSDASDPSPEDIQHRREQTLKRRRELDDAAREEQKKLHWMKCPKCGSDLEEIAFRGVKIDKCFVCGGVYLDDGELEQLAGKPGWFEALRYLFS